VLDLTDQQELFRNTTVRFIDARGPMSEVRRLAHEPISTEHALRRDAAALGWFSMFVPEEFGGGSVSGAPLRDAAIVAEARGRSVQPGAFTGTNVVAFALAQQGSAAQRAEYLPGLATGELTGAWAISDAGGSPAVGAVRVAGSTLHGTAGLVAEGASADVFLVTARHDDGNGGVSQFVVPAAHAGVTVVPMRSLDLTQRFARVEFEGVATAPDALVGEPGGAAHIVAQQTDIAAVLTVADAVGAMQRLMDVTVDYAKQRIAFGRPIGSFQALKHLLADASLRVEVSNAALDAALDAVTDDRATASEIVSIAKAYAGDAGVDVAQTCFQAHGGIAFTWEHDLHFFLRRLQTDRALYGDPAWHHERICRRHGLGAAHETRAP
jgi:alkylation response protein AidB-like acyl-CoA dehydrogenase